jgi:apolipoprotein N-acyltransferase
VLQQTAISEQAVLYADVPRLTGTTPAQALGDLPALVAAAAALLLVGRPRWRRIRDLERSAEHGE